MKKTNEQKDEYILVDDERIKIKRVTEYNLPELDNSEFILR